MPRSRWVLPLLLACAACQPVAESPDRGGTDAVPEPAAHCRSLLDAPAPDTELTSARLETGREDLPTFCEANGRIAGRIGFTLRLPARNWNGKFVVAGCGGFCGAVLPDKPGYSNSINEALKLGYAAITSDSGHQAPNWSTDWALQDPTALELYAGAWMPKVVAAGRALLRAYYQGDPRRTYFSGCSNGGRLGLFAAQRYPQLFDGIAAGGGIFDMTGNAGVHGLWLLQTVRDEQGQPVIPREKIPLLSEAILAQCDGLDAVQDQIVSRPELCQPELDKLQCRAGTREIARESSMGARGDSMKNNVFGDS